MLFVGVVVVWCCMFVCVVGWLLCGVCIMFVVCGMYACMCVYVGVCMVYA